MSSLTVLCPNGHRVKVVTNPNMSLQAVLETAAAKKGFDPSSHFLEFHRKRLDLSNSIRFSGNLGSQITTFYMIEYLPGIPNNATVEMSPLTEEELQSQSQQDVTVCLQLPDGQRLMENFPSSTNLQSVMDKFSSQLGEPGDGEEPVMVYMRKELVGREEIAANSLRTLGLIQGRGLFRFFYKKPEELKSQANVYDMKVQEKKSPAPEVPHVPMRVAPDNTVETVQTAQETEENSKLQLEDVNQDVLEMEETEVKPTTNSDPQPSGSQAEYKVEAERMQTESPDSTQPEPVINILADDHDAVVFCATEADVKYQDLDDNFFELSLDEVKVMYRDLKQEVKKLSEGENLMTREMRESQKEADKLSKLSQYKSCVLRIQFPCRHVVQGIFPPLTEISSVQSWLCRHLLASPDTPFELFTAPPRTVLPASATLLDLGLFPAALVHFSSLVTRAPPVQHLTDTVLSSLSNVTGANTVASRARRRLANISQADRSDRSDSSTDTR